MVVGFRQLNFKTQNYEFSKEFHTFKCIYSFILLKKLNMKNKHITYSHEQARIYRHYYKPSLNFLRLFKSILSVFFSGASAASSHARRR